MNLSKFGALNKVTEGTCSGWRRFRATNVDGRLRVRVVTGAGVLRYQNNDTTRTRRHPRPFRPYSQEHARVLRVRAHPRAGAGATRTRLLPCLGLLVIWGAHAATCGVQKVAVWGALEGPGWHL